MGRIIGWGYNSVGQTKNVNVDDIIDVVGGSEHSVALRSNSSVIAWGDSRFADVPECVLSNVVSIACGWYHSLALMYDGTVAGWGHKASVPQNIPRLSKIAAGEMFSVGVTAEGEMIVWGPHAPILPEIMRMNVKDVVASKNHIMILKEGDNVMICDKAGELYTDIPFNVHYDVKKIATGRNRFFVLKNDGSVIYWGEKLKNILDHELKKDVVDIVSGDDFIVILKRDGSVMAMGEKWGDQLKVPELESNERVVKISVGNHHGFLLIDDN